MAGALLQSERAIEGKLRMARKKAERAVVAIGQGAGDVEPGLGGLRSQARGPEGLVPGVRRGFAGRAFIRSVLRRAPEFLRRSRGRGRISTRDLETDELAVRVGISRRGCDCSTQLRACLVAPALAERDASREQMSGRVSGTSIERVVQL